VVTVTSADLGGVFASWSVNVATQDITAADQVASETGQVCPALA
jgi:hypothetical protein